jgi:hypothetical protein
MYQNGMNTTYFHWVPTDEENLLRAAKIIGWGTGGITHVAFFEGYFYSQVPHEDEDPEYVTYGDLEAEWGTPTGYFEEIGNRTRNVTAQNTFGDNSHGGTVKWDDASWTSNLPKTFGHATQHSLAVVTGQLSAQSIRQEFDRWVNSYGTLNDPSASIQIWIQSTNPTYSAIHKNLYDVQFQYSKPTGTFTGAIIVNGQSQSTPTSTYEIEEDQSISAQASTYFHSENVSFLFSNWSPGGSTNPSSSFTPGGASQLYTVTANFSPKPLPPADLYAGGTVGDPVQLTWTSHSASSGVTEYQIWRKVKPKNQGEQSPVLLTTVSRTTTSYTDYEYSVTSGYTDDLVSYDVRARYNAGGVSAYADPNWVVAFAEILLKTTKKVRSPEALTGPASYTLSAEPNPFNPNTLIRYELPEPSSVRIELYDAAGRKVADLVDLARPAGRFSVPWSGRDEVGRAASSGVYYCRMTAIPSAGGNAVLQTVRLLLIK